MGQRKAFYRQRIPEFRCVRKETIDLDIFATSGNGDRKIMQSIRIMSRPPSRITFKKNFMDPFYGWGSNVSRLQNHYEETVYFLPISSQQFLVLISSTSEG